MLTPSVPVPCYPVRKDANKQNCQPVSCPVTQTFCGSLCARAIFPSHTHAQSIAFSGKIYLISQKSQEVRKCTWAAVTQKHTAT